MNPLIFCPNSAFEGGVINILHTHLFNSPIQSLPGAFPQFHQINNIYAQMRRLLNCSGLYNLYLADGNCLNKYFTGKVFYGHDLPIWLNDPIRNDYRLMIVSECPRRGDNEMYDKSKTVSQLSISSPFGTHSTYWRRGRNGIVPQVVQAIIEKAKTTCNIELAVYFTDAYKLCNRNDYVSLYRNRVYIDILCEEIKLYNPNYIIALGNRADNLLNQTLKKCVCLSQIKYKMIPHPSRQSKRVFQSRIIEILKPELCKEITKE
jgi:uracil-DNA glycosylase